MIESKENIVWNQDRPSLFRQCIVCKTTEIKGSRTVQGRYFIWLL